MKRSQVLEIARAEIGYLEKKSNESLDSKTINAGKKNFTKYWRDICPNLQGSAWCQCFVNWIMWQAENKDAETARHKIGQGGTWTFYTPDAVARAKQWGLWTQGTAEIQPGDIIYFYGYVSSEGKNRVHHVEIVEKVTESEIFTIGGNTAAGQGVIDNGGQVARKKYMIGDAALYGYIRPKYDAEVPEDQKIGWHKDNNGWWCRHTEGIGPNTYYHDTVAEINGKFYAFDKNGYMIEDAGKIGIRKSGEIYVR